MIRTQVYLDDEIKTKLKRLSTKRRVTVSNLIRQALELFLERHSESFEDAVEKSFGIWKNRKDPVDVGKLRREWEKRETRIRQ